MKSSFSTVSQDTFYLNIIHVSILHMQVKNLSLITFNDQTSSSQCLIVAMGG